MQKIEKIEVFNTWRLLIIFGIFFKWRYSDRKSSKVVPCMTEWPNDQFWPYNKFSAKKLYDIVGVSLMVYK